MDVLLWGVLPYLVIATLVLGTIWRYRYDKFGWTTRSSQLYESRLLRIGSPLFHFGILVVFIGHVGGLVIPESWTEAVGVTEGIYHFNALLFGGIAGFCTLAGILILVVRRRLTGPVFMATTVNDKVMYVLLVGAITLGLWTTLVAVGAGHEAHNYRETVSPWFRSIWLLQPGRRRHGGRADPVPRPRPGRDAAVRGVALHAARARLHRTGPLPVPALHRLPQPRRPYAGADRPAPRRLEPGRHARP